MKIAQLLRFLNTIAPEESAFPNDPVGLLVGGQEAEFLRVGVALDATLAVAEEAVARDIDVLVVHHPLIYQPLKRLHPDDPIGRIVRLLIKHDIVVYAMHTNWDLAASGINETLGQTLGLRTVTSLSDSGEARIARIGDLSAPVAADSFIRTVAHQLNCTGMNAIRWNDALVEDQQVVFRIAVCGGAGGGLVSIAAAAGADAYVTSDIRHHEFIEATSRGLLLIDAGHQATETPGMVRLAEIIGARFSEIEVDFLPASSS